MTEENTLEEIRQQVLDGLKQGKPMFGKDGAFAPLIQNILNAALEGEMDAHMTEEERLAGNRRNGKTTKQVQTSVGEITVSTPRDRNGSFEPQIIKKRETMLADNMSESIIAMYALGAGTREISKFMEDTVGTSVSAETISAVTDRVLPELREWHSRSLEEVYAIIWLDAIHYKVKDEGGRTVSRAIYNVLGVNKEGKKDLLGMYVSKSEGASFWLSVLTDLQNRGVKDTMFACIDGLKGFPDAIKSVFPDTKVQMCVVHQIRNSLKYVASKNQKEFVKDLKTVYQAVSKDAAELALDKLDAKWGRDYPIVIKSWRDNWEHLSEYFRYSEPIRRLIYTTNTVEGYHRQVRKVTKNKGVFPTDQSLEKLVYLAYRNIKRKWTMPVANWGIIAQQLAIEFGERFNLL